MTQEKQPSAGQKRFWHWVRVAVMFLSFGFIFPHALTEEDPDIVHRNAEDDPSGKGS